MPNVLRRSILQDPESVQQEMALEIVLEGADKSQNPGFAEQGGPFGCKVVCAEGTTYREATALAAAKLAEVTNGRNARLAAQAKRAQPRTSLGNHLQWQQVSAVVKVEVAACLWNGKPVPMDAAAAAGTHQLKVAQTAQMAEAQKGCCALM